MCGFYFLSGALRKIQEITQYTCDITLASVEPLISLELNKKLGTFFGGSVTGSTEDANRSCLQNLRMNFFLCPKRTAKEN